MCETRTTVRDMGVFINFIWGGAKLFSPPGGVIIRHCAVECLVSVSNCVIYIRPLQLNYKYHDIIGVVLRQAAFLSVIFYWWPTWGWGVGGGRGGGGGGGVGGWAGLGWGVWGRGGVRGGAPPPTPRPPKYVTTEPAAYWATEPTADD